MSIGVFIWSACKCPLLDEINQGYWSLVGLISPDGTQNTRSSPSESRSAIVSQWPLLRNEWDVRVVPSIVVIMVVVEMVIMIINVIMVVVVVVPFFINVEFIHLDLLFYLVWV